MVISETNDRVDLIFFQRSSKEAYLTDRQLEKKKRSKKAQAKVVKCTKNKSWIPRNPPPSHVSVEK